jgi:autophagy-related protein 11
LYSTGSLELFLQQEIGVEQDAAVAYLSDGKRLTTSNIRDLGSAQDQVSRPRSTYVVIEYANVLKFIFVFNKHYLDYEIEDVLRQLHIDPPFQPTIEGSYYIV